MKKPNIFANAGRELHEKPIQRVNDIFSIVGNARDMVAFFAKITSLFANIKDLASLVVSGFASIFALASAGGVATNLVGSSALGSIFAPFPVKTLIFIIMSAAMGWTFAAGAVWFSGRYTEMAQITGYVTGMVWASIFVALANGIFLSQRDPNISIYLVFCAVGLCVSLLLSMSKFRDVRTTDVRNLTYQTGVTALYVAGVVLIAPISILAG